MMLAGYYPGQAYLGQSDETVQEERPLPSNWQASEAPLTNSTPAAGPHRGSWRKSSIPRGNWRRSEPPLTNWNPDD